MSMISTRYEDLSFTKRNLEPFINFQPPVRRLSCCDKNQDLTDIGLGIITFLAEFPISLALGTNVYHLMKRCGVEFTHKQDVWEVIDTIENIPYSFSRVIVKTAILAYIVIFGPILEEVMFRMVIQEAMRDANESTTQKVTRVALSALIFGAAHLSPNQGWTNVPVFVVTSFLGLVFALQKEFTGGIKASATTHILHNATAVAIFYATWK